MSEVLVEEPTKSSSNHYLELSQVPITFQPIDQVESAFFDQSNFQMLCVQHGYTDVKVKGISPEDTFKITLPSRGPVSTIKFSGGKPRILPIQRRKVSVEFVNIFSGNSVERSLPKVLGANIIGFYWIFKNQFVVLILTSGIEVYACVPQRMSFKLVSSYGMDISWAVFSPEALLLLVCAKSSNMLHPFIFKEGTPNAIMRLPKFEVEIGVPMANPTASIRDSKNATVMERDVVIMRLYGQHYVVVIRNTLLPGKGAEVLLYRVTNDNNPARLAHILTIDISGRFTLSAVDDLVIVHHQAWKTSLLFDIMFGDNDSSGQVKKHQAVLAPLAIAPAELQVHHKGGKAQALSPSGSITSLPGNSPSMYEKKTILPELYSSKWVFFQPDLIVDAQYGVIWRLTLNLEAISNMIPGKSVLIEFLLKRKFGEEIVLSVYRIFLEHRQLDLVTNLLDQVNFAYKKSTLPQDPVGKTYKVVISQREMCTRVFVPFSECKDISYDFLLSALMEYIRSLNKAQLQMEPILLELLINILTENKCIRQFYHISSLIGDNQANTLLHIASEIGSENCVRTLLRLNPPIMLRNAAGKTARDVASFNDAKPLLDAYITENQMITTMKYFAMPRKYTPMPSE